MKKVFFLFFLLFSLFPLSVKAEKVTYSTYDFILSRKVIIKKPGQFQLLDSYSEKPGEYDFPCYICWDYCATVEYEKTWNPIKNKIEEKKALKKAKIMSEKGLAKKIKSTEYEIPIKTLHNNKWIDYKTIHVFGKDSVLIQ